MIQSVDVCGLYVFERPILPNSMIPLDTLEVIFQVDRSPSIHLPSQAILDTYHLMKHEGHSFPVLKEADAMFVAESAPEWKDGEVCHRCRVQFSMVVRKHHCRFKGV